MTRAPVNLIPGHTIERFNSPNRGGAMSGHKGPVVHIAEGSYRGTISWQMNPDQRYANGTKVTTSSSWIVGRNPGEIAEMGDQDDIAWCQRGGSRDRSSIELAGHAPDAPSAWQIEACAHILAWEHRTYGVPLAVADNPSVKGLGHHSMDREWLGEEWGHDSCPGAGVIAAKDAIVARAKAIVAGEDTFMAGLTEDEQRELLTGVRYLKNICNVAGYRVEALVSNRATYNNQMGNKAAPNLLAQRLGALGEAVARESASPDEVRELLNAMPAPASAEAIGDEVIAGLGVRPAAEVLAALKAAGVNLDDLRAELDRIAAGTAHDAPAASGS